MNDDKPDLRGLYARVYKMADTLQAHEVKLGEHGVLITVLNTQYAALRSETATKDNVNAAVSLVKNDIQGLRDDLAPIKRGIGWVIALVLGAVATAILGLVIRGRLP